MAIVRSTTLFSVQSVTDLPSDHTGKLGSYVGIADGRFVGQRGWGGFDFGFVQSGASLGLQWGALVKRRKIGCTLEGGESGLLISRVTLVEDALMDRNGR